jgi:hypothetical protein
MGRLRDHYEIDSYIAALKSNLSRSEFEVLMKAAGVPAERLQIVLNRASEFGVVSTAQIERVLGFTISFSVNSDYRTVASAVNAGVPMSSLRESEINPQLDAIARAIASFRSVGEDQSDAGQARHKSGLRAPAH